MSLTSLSTLVFAQSIPQTLQLGVIGDSISRGYDIKSLRTESLDLVWASGTSLSTSHYNRLLAMSPGLKINVNNLALVGDTVTEKDSQFQARAQQMADAGADYVSILIGANDICGGDLGTQSGLNAFQRGVSVALSTLLSSAHPPKIIVVSSIPHIWQLTQIPELSSNPFCNMVWDQACSNLQIGQEKFDEQWTAANRALEDAAAAAGPHVVFDNMAVANKNFTADEISGKDCFHPSEKGQGILATEVWNQVSGKVSELLFSK